MQGEAQLKELSQRLKGSGITAVITAPENRTTVTAAAITKSLGLPAAKVDGNLTSKLTKKANGGKAEEPADRAQRGLRVVENFLRQTKGDVAIVSHGQARSIRMRSVGG